MQIFAIVELQAPVSSAAQGMRLFQYHVEDWGEIAGRGVDDLQHLGSRGLLLQCLARLVDESRVLHRDNRLRGETFQYRDLLFGEGTDPMAMGADEADQAGVLAQRHKQSGAQIRKLEKGTRDLPVRPA